VTLQRHIGQFDGSSVMVTVSVCLIAFCDIVQMTFDDLVESSYVIGDKTVYRGNRSITHRKQDKSS